MPVPRSTLAIAAAWLLFWLLMIAVAVQDFVRDGEDGPLWQPLVWEGSSMIVASLLLLAQTRWDGRYRHLLDRPRRWFAAQALWLPVYWALFVPLAFGIRHAVYGLAGAVYEHPPWLETFVYESLKLTVFVGMFTAIRFGILSHRALLEQKLRAERSHALLRQAQLAQLTQQMQPHFLFNALNTVSSLMHSDVERADAVLTRLGDVLRAALDAGDKTELTLEAELKLVRAYAGVMEERHAGRVAIEWHIAPAALACKVPVMSLQPLLENVFKHVVERRRGATRIAVAAACADGFLHISVEDDGGVLGAGAPGIGLANLRARLAALHGDTAALTLSQQGAAGVRAEMRLPCGC